MRQIGMHTAFAAAGTMLLLVLGGCAVGMALTGRGEPNLEALRVGATRAEVEARLGSPISSLKNPDGGKADAYEYGLRKPPNLDRALTHAIMDVISAGWWELYVGTWQELCEAKGTRCRITVTYGSDDHALVIERIGCAMTVCYPNFSVTTWRDARETTPITSSPSEEGITPSMGALRRLALGVIREKGRTVLEWSPEVTRVLRDLKGYEVIPLHLFEDLLIERLKVLPGKLGANVETLVQWARESPDGASPSAEVVSIVCTLGRAMNVDGLVIVQDGKAEGFSLARALRVDVYEAATGRIV